MPREKKKRGRRAEQRAKRKLDGDEADGEYRNAKRRKSHNDEGDDAAIDEGTPVDAFTSYEVDGYELPVANGPQAPEPAPFVGLLDEEEQEYFKRADGMLELNQFEGPEERSLFLANVYREAEGKELKLANSQSCSRLLERLILLSTPGQLKNLFQQFSGHFLHLVQHRFASHCCEALFVQAAPIVTQELAAGAPVAEENGDPNKIVESMENYFLHTINELSGYVGYLMTDRFASHALRILLVVLSGQPLAAPSRRTLTQSRRKEHITIDGLERQEMSLEQRSVPVSFDNAMDKLLRECVSGLDTQYLRALATHKTGNPVLQLLLRIELSHSGRQRGKDDNAVLRKLLPENEMVADSETMAFMSSLTYDAVGSRLIEVIIESAPGRVFKTLYKQFFKERLPSLARNDIAGYVASKVLERLGPDDLREAVDALAPQISKLVERNRTNVIRTAIERCGVRDVDTTPLASALEKAYSGPDGFDLARLLRLGEPRQASASADPSSPPSASSIPASTHSGAASEKVHGSLLAQSMLTLPGPISSLIFTSLLALPKTLVLKMAYDPASSRVIQAALVSPHATVIFRRKVIQLFYGEFGAMALDPSASRVIDSIWSGTQGLAFIRERIAEELAENEASLRESGVGRHVWRRWELDLWRRRRGEWVARCRESAGNDGFIGFPESGAVVAPAGKLAAAGGEQARRDGAGEGGEKKSAIKLARERHAAQKAAAETRAKKRQRRDAGAADENGNVEA